MTVPYGAVPPDAVLSCLSEILAEHYSRVGSAGAALFVPVLLDERERYTRLLTELFRTADGVLIDATQSGAGVAVTSDPRTFQVKLVAAVSSLLSDYNAFDPSAELALDLTDSHVEIQGATDYATANTAQKAVREVLTALFDESLQADGLTGLVWADDSLDERLSALVWRLLMTLPALLDLHSSSTLVLLAGDASLNPDVHCAGEQSTRYRVSDSGLARRRRWEANRAAVAELSRYDRDAAPLIPLFFGAGVSVVEGLPTGNTLRDRALANQVGVPRVDRHNYREAAGELWARLEYEGNLKPDERSAGPDAFAERLTLERVLLEEQAQEHQRDCTTIRAFRTEHDAVITALTTAQAAGEFDADPLVRVFASQQRFVVITVNFDRVVETKARGLMRPFITEQDFADLADYLPEYAKHGGAVPLLKLHGDVDVPNTIVANQEETEAGLSAARMSALESVITTVGTQNVRPWWYIGYSMRDLDLEPVLSNPAFVDKMAERWVAPFVDPAVRRFIERYRMARWRSDGSRYSADERVVSLTASDFFGLLFADVASSWTAPLPPP